MSVQVTASGEALALNGDAYPPAYSGAPAFVDGWEVRFSKLLAVFDKVTLSENPDLSPTDQSKHLGVVAEIHGPWAIDLHKGGPLPGTVGASEQASLIQTISVQNPNSLAVFDPGVRYAFGFESVPATDAATLLQIDKADPDWKEMVARGWNVLYVGTATWRGGMSCTSTNPNYDFTLLPTTVNFRFGFATPTTYINCQNHDNGESTFAGERYNRGVWTQRHDSAVAQVTFHIDHPFWESFTHDTPAHFDQLAALATPDANGNYNVTLDAAMGVNYQAFKDQAGRPLPWRVCAPNYSPPSGSIQMGFDSLSIPYRPGGGPSTGMRDYRDYMRYQQSTQGHLNSNGQCYVERHYPSPQ